METTPSGWTIIDKERGVLSLDYSFTAGASSRTFAARIADGGMMVVSPSTGLTDVVAAELTEFGPVTAIVANNGFHHLGQAKWRERFPQARCFAPELAGKRISKKNSKAGTFEPLSALEPLLGDDVGLRDVPNSKLGESWYWAKVDGGYAWFVSDVLANLDALPAKFPIKYLFKWTKSAPGYRVFNLALKFMVKNKKATLQLLLDDLAAHPPTVMVPAHGAILAQDGIAKDTHALVSAAL